VGEEFQGFAAVKHFVDPGRVESGQHQGKFARKSKFFQSLSNLVNKNSSGRVNKYLGLSRISPLFIAGQKFVCVGFGHNPSLLSGQVNG